MTKVSVIVPIYNMEGYLEQCLDSIVSQTLKDIEIICINDGSTDRCFDILKNFSNRYSNICLINQANAGVSKSRNRGIDFAEGEFVCFIDPDDWYPEKDILECLYEKAKEEGVNICGGSFSSYYNGNIKDNYEGTSAGYTFRVNAKVNFMDYQWDYGYHRFIYRRSMLINNNIYFPEYSRYQDPPFFVRAMLQAVEFYGISKITYRYRIGHQNIDWNEKKTGDLLRGLTDNLYISKQNGLSRLHYNTVLRMNDSFYQPIRKHVINNNQEIIDLLIQAGKSIDIALLQKEDHKIQDNYMPILMQENIVEKAMNKLS